MWGRLSTTTEAADVAPVRASGLRLRYSGGVEGLRGVDLELRPGSLTALIGGNGAGKSSLLRILGGFLRPTEGWAEILGQTELRQIRHRLGYVPQDAALDPELTGRETLDLMAALYGVKRRSRARKVEELAAAYGIAEPLRRRVGTWSGGLKQRLHLAASLIHEPELLLLDEPTAGLDAEGSALFWQDMRRRCGGGNTVLVATHDLEAVARHADRVVLLDHGQIVADGPSQDLPGLHGEADLTALFLRFCKREAGNRRGQKKGQRQ